MKKSTSNCHFYGCWLFSLDSLAVGNRAPETADDFEGLVVCEPKSSSRSILCMAYCIRIHEIVCAREDAERVLKTISFREEKEKFNVWIALVRLEGLYGFPHSMNSVFQRVIEYGIDASMLHLTRRFA